MRDNRPIGIMDSGLGGISFLLEAERRLPAEHFIYYGDNANLPYGMKKSERIQELALSSADKLLKHDVKAIVVACNTASSAALEALRARYPHMPIIGLEPALKPALQVSGEKRVLLLATKGTIELPRLRGMIEALGASKRAELVPCPGLVEAVERLAPQKEMRDYIRALLPDEQTDYGAAVLGCTHFVFARPAVRMLLGNCVPILDGNTGALNQLIRRLNEEELLTEQRDRGNVTFLSSGGLEAIANMEQLYKLGLPE